MRSAFVLLVRLASLAASACATVPDLYFGTDDAEAGDASIADGGADTSIVDTSILDTSIADVVLDAADTSVPAGITSIAQGGALADHVGMNDVALAPDGLPDGILDVTLEGPLTALVLVVTNGNGMPNKADVWDTLVGTDPIPATIGVNYTQGVETWILGAFDGATRVNGADGRFAIAVGTRHLTLAAADGGRFKKGAHFALLARLADGATWVKSDVVSWK